MSANDKTQNDRTSKSPIQNNSLQSLASEKKPQNKTMSEYEQILPKYEQVLSGRERVLSVLEGKPSDTLPLMPITMMFAADQIGIPYGQYATEAPVLVKGQFQTADEFGFDYVSAISDPACEAADLGATVIFYENQPPALDESNALLSDKIRLKYLQHPDVQRQGSRMRNRVQAIELFKQEMLSRKNPLIIEGWVEGPCAEGADLRGISHLMLDFFDDPDFVHQLFAFNLETALAFADAQIKAGADIIGIGDAAASLVGPELFREFVFPYEKKLIREIQNLGGRVRLHICGNISRSLNEIALYQANMIDLDFMVSVAAARSAFGQNQTIAGNIDPVRILRNGSPELICSELQKCLDASAYPDSTIEQSGVSKENNEPQQDNVSQRDDELHRYIVAAGCEIPRDTPAKNVRALTSFARSRR